MRTAFKFLATAALAAGTTTASQAATVVYSVTLSGAAESPANASPGIGTGTVTIDDVLNTMRVQVTFSGLSGGVTASHIHAATAVPGVGTAGVATVTPTFTGFPTGVTSGSYDATFNLLGAGTYNPAFVTANGGTFASAETALLTAMAGGRSYLNIHTTAFPGGEIRGFLSAVPEPATWAMMVCGLGLIGAALRRRSRIALPA